MSTTNTPNHPAGVPCWIETLQPDPEAAARHYAELFGWTADDPVPTSDGPYRTFRLDGRIVAGLDQAPPGLPTAVWTTYVAVDDLDATIAVAVEAGGSVLLPPSPAVGDGRRAILTDPAGVAFGLWQAGTLGGVEREHEPGAWTMSSLHTPDPDGAERFYGRLFGWRADREAAGGAPIAFWRLDGHRRREPVTGCPADDAPTGAGRVDGAHGREPATTPPPDTVGVLVPIAEGDPTPPHWSVCVQVADVRATADRATALSGGVLMDPAEAPGGASGVIADPQGGVVAITELTG